MLVARFDLRQTEFWEVLGIYAVLKFTTIYCCVVTRTDLTSKVGKLETGQQGRGLENRKGLHTTSEPFKHETSGEDEHCSPAYQQRIRLPPLTPRVSELWDKYKVQRFSAPPKKTPSNALLEEDVPSNTRNLNPPLPSHHLPGARSSMAATACKA